MSFISAATQIIVIFVVAVAIGRSMAVGCYRPDSHLCQSWHAFYGNRLNAVVRSNWN